MQRTLVTLACVLALAGGSALAQQQQDQGSSGASITEKAKHAAQVIGEKTREAAEIAKEKVEATAQKAKGAVGDKTASEDQSDRGRQMQQQADADLKAARQKCDAMQQKLQKTLCEKEAAAAHANAEVEIAKADLAAQGGGTAAMGAGKSEQHTPSAQQKPRQKHKGSSHSSRD